MFLDFLAGSLSIAGSQVLVISLLTGIGLLLRRGFALSTIDLNALFTSFWSGFVATLGLLALAHFAIPISGWVTLVIASLGAIGLFVSRTDLAEALPPRASLHAPFSLIFVIGMTLWLASLSTAALTHWDTGLYHMQAVLWVKQYAIVPGLANLHGPLGLQSTSYLFAAMLDTGPWTGESYRLANGVLILVLVWQALAGGARFLDERNDLRHVGLFDFMLLAPALYIGLDDRIVSYATDIPVSCVLLAAASKAYRFFAAADASPEGSSSEDRFTFVYVAGLLAAAVTLKMSVAVFAAALWVAIASLWWHRSSKTDTSRMRVMLYATFVPVAFGIVWGARNVILSGYLSYPLTTVAYPVEWAALKEHADAEYANIVYTAFLLSFDYFPRWFDYVWSWVPYPVLVPLLITVGTLIGQIRTAPRTSSVGADDDRANWLYLPLVVAAVAWFLSGPAPRYADFAFWSMAALSVSQAYRASSREKDIRSPMRVFAAVAILGLSPPILSPVQTAYREAIAHDTSLDIGILRTLYHANVKASDDGAWFAPMQPVRPVETFTTDSGLVLNVPTGKCWDTPIPCTANPAPNLRLRTPNSLSDGFAVEGEWQMKNWPYWWRPDFLDIWREYQRDLE